MRNAIKLFDIVLFVSLSLFLAGAVYGAFDEIPRVTIQELKRMMDEKADIVILDAQPGSVYAVGHIKGAISFPWARKLTEAQVAKLPRNKPIIVYCDCGPGEGDSASVAAQLIDFSFVDLKVLKDPSITGWKEAGYPVE